MITTSRLRWYGHVERLHEETPAKQALAEARRKVKKARGGLTITWLKVLEKDLKELSKNCQRQVRVEKDSLEIKSIRVDSP